jgi:acetyltransferase
MGVAIPGGASSWIGTIPRDFVGGHVAAVVQSGSIGEALLALGPRIGFRAVVSTGAEASVDVCDYLDWAASDNETRAVGLFLETIRRPAAFARALERCAAAGKPVACLKIGRSQAAARAALAHTGAIVGSHVAFSALLRRYGALEVHDFAELVELLEVLGRPRRPRGTRVGGVTESGGEGALLADHAEATGLSLDPLPRAVIDQLQHDFPLLQDLGNPVDPWAVDEPETIYPRCLEVLAGSGAFDILVAQLDLSRFRGETEQRWSRAIVQALAEACSGTDVFPVVCTIHTTDPPAWAQELAREHDVALLRGTANATRALAMAAGWRPTRPSGAAQQEPVDLDDLLADDGPLPEHESALALERYGVRFAPRRRAQDPQAASDAAAEIGFPVVVKVDGAAHKARVGGVVLDVRRAEEAASAARRLGGPVLVAKQVSRGTEAFCGMTRDAQFGPVLAVGHGGTDIERVRAAAFGLAPLERDAALTLVDEVGFEEGRETLADTLVAISRLSVDHPEVVEVDVNPLILGDHGAVAVDALVVIGRGDAP